MAINRNLVIAAAVPAVLAIVAAYFAWSASSDLDGVRRELNTTKTQADRSRNELQAARTELAKVQQEFTALKITAEQANGVKLRQDLEAAKQQISQLSARLAGRR